MAKEIKYGSEARAALGAGVDKLANRRADLFMRNTLEHGVNTVLRDLLPLRK